MNLDIAAPVATATPPRGNRPATGGRDAGPGDGGFGDEMERALAAGDRARGPRTRLDKAPRAAHPGRPGSVPAPAGRSGAERAARARTARPCDEDRPATPGARADTRDGSGEPPDQAPAVDVTGGAPGPDASGETVDPCCTTPAPTLPVPTTATATADPEPLVSSGPVVAAVGALTGDPVRAAAATPGPNADDGTTGPATDSAVGTAPAGTSPAGTSPAGTSPAGTSPAVPTDPSATDAGADGRGGDADSRPARPDPAPAGTPTPASRGPSTSDDAPSAPATGTTTGASPVVPPPAEPAAPVPAAVPAAAGPVEAVPATPAPGAVPPVAVPTAPLPPAVDAPSPVAAPPAPVAHPTPAQQIAPHLVALSTGVDGTHRMTLQLHPEDLGSVRISVELLGQTVNVSLVGDGDAARDLMRGSLGDLRRELAAAGLDTGTLDVTTRQPGSGPPGQGDGTPPRGRAFGDGAGEPATQARQSTTRDPHRGAGPDHSGAIDVTV